MSPRATKILSIVRPARIASGNGVAPLDQVFPVLTDLLFTVFHIVKFLLYIFILTMRIGIDNIFYHTIPPSATESATFAFSFFCRLDLSVRNRYAESKNKRRAVSACSGTSSPCRRARDADFAVAVTDDSLAPWIKKGGTAYLRRRTELYDGDIGLFETDGGIVFRQFCADSRGTVYLFAVNRAHAEDDRMIPPDKAAELVCYGRLELKKPIPLPMD